jgi:hypothetical protein
MIHYNHLKYFSEWKVEWAAILINSDSGKFIKSKPNTILACEILFLDDSNFWE